jgi:hypothetical protein
MKFLNEECNSLQQRLVKCKAKKDKNKRGSFAKFTTIGKIRQSSANVCFFNASQIFKFSSFCSFTFSSGSPEHQPGAKYNKNPGRSGENRTDRCPEKPGEFFGANLKMCPGPTQLQIHFQLGSIGYGQDRISLLVYLKTSKNLLKLKGQAFMNYDHYRPT